MFLHYVNFGGKCLTENTNLAQRASDVLDQVLAFFRYSMYVVI